MSNKNRQTPHANQKQENNLILYVLLSVDIYQYINIYTYIHIHIYTYYSINYTLGFAELRYIPLKLNKLNITDVIYLSLTTVP